MDVVEGGLGIPGLGGDPLADPAPEEVSLVPAVLGGEPVGVARHPPLIVQEVPEVELGEDLLCFGRGIVEAHQERIDRPGRGAADPHDVRQDSLGLQDLRGPDVGDALDASAFEDEIPKLVWHLFSSSPAGRLHRFVGRRPIDGGQRDVL